MSLLSASLPSQAVRQPGPHEAWSDPPGRGHPGEARAPQGPWLRTGLSAQVPATHTEVQGKKNEGAGKRRGLGAP